MPELESVSNPVDAGMAAVEAAPERSVRPGATGRRADATSAAERHLIVRGRRDRPFPRRPATSLETIIGDEDDRTRVLETEVTPWRWICSLEIDGFLVGTAWLAGPRTLITAGHCVYDKRKLGGWAREIEIAPGRNADVLPFQSLSSRSFSSVGVWVDDENRDYDIGAIHLDTPLGDDLGWFAVGALPPAELLDALVNVSGYPLRPGGGTMQYHHANRIVHVANRIFYDADTWGGESGAPVFLDADGDAHPTVVGIHAYGEGATPSPLPESNSGPRISQAVLDRIARWVEFGRDAG